MTSVLNKYRNCHAYLSITVCHVIALPVSLDEEPCHDQAFARHNIATLPLYK